LSFGGLVVGKTGISPSLLNAKGLFKGTGAEIAALSTSTQVSLAYCTQTLSGFLQDHYYFRRVDNTWEVLNLSKHDHAQDDDDSGGLFSTMLYNNMHLYYRKQYSGFFGNEMVIDLANTGGPGVFSLFQDGSGATQLVTGNLATTYTNVRNGGRRHDWAKRSRFDIKCRVDTATQVVARAGTGMETLALGNDVNPKYGIEFCDSTGANWQIVSASGSTRSLFNTTLPGSTAGPLLYKLEHTPGVPGTGQVRLTLGLSSTPFFVKTSDPPPATGGSDPVRTVDVGIKTQDTNIKKFIVWFMGFEGLLAPNDV
jgi:hypothetical protein